MLVARLVVLLDARSSSGTVLTVGAACYQTDHEPWSEHDYCIAPREATDGALRCDRKPSAAGVMWVPVS
jgi:hypothetical protein